MKLPLRYIGDEILREKAKPIESITEEVKALANNMLETMRSCNGLGLAAPQVGYAVRLFVITVIDEVNDRKVKTEIERVYINPKIISVSEEMVGMNEGCLSIPGLYIDDIIRPKTITVTSMDLDGNSVTETISGWHARVVLHENDHLNGVLFIDRLLPKQRKGVYEEIKKIKKKLEQKLRIRN